MIQATPRMKFDWSHLMVEGVLFCCWQVWMKKRSLNVQILQL